MRRGLDKVKGSGSVRGLVIELSFPNSLSTSWLTCSEFQTGCACNPYQSNLLDERRSGGRGGITLEKRVAPEGRFVA